MSLVALVAYLLAAVLFLAGAVSASRSLSAPAEGDEDGRTRLLIAVHDAAKALFWFALGAFVLAYELAAEPQGVRWLALIPLGMAVVRLLAATALSRS